MPRKARAFFDGLPDPIRVYRGCSRQHVMGIAWTTDRDVAKGFAQGHRGIPVPDAIIAEADIPKSAVFAIFLERDESEVLLNPERARMRSIARALR